MLYFEKPRAIEAVHWTGDNLAAVQTVAPSALLNENGELVVTTADGERVVSPGQYVTYSQGWQANEIYDADWFETSWAPVPAQYRID